MDSGEMVGQDGRILLADWWMHNYEPTYLWNNFLSQDHKVEEIGDLSAYDGGAPRPQGHLRIVFISDTHHFEKFLPPILKADVLIHCGDFTRCGDRNEIEEFSKWLHVQSKHLKYKPIVIAGNHEVSMDRELYPSKLFKRFHYGKFIPHEGVMKEPWDVEETRALLTNCTYLENEGIEIEGIKIWGSPYSPWYECDLLRLIPLELLSCLSIYLTFFIYIYIYIPPSPIIMSFSLF